MEPQIDEASGLAASRSTPGLWWTHNDSGDIARLFALDGSGDLVGSITLDGIDADDWEDLAIAPGANGNSWLSIGDIGDNPWDRPSIRILRLPEPETIGEILWEADEALEDWTVHYDDGPRDAETLLVDPRTGETYIVSKEKATPTGLYHVDLPPAGQGGRGGTAWARRVADLPLFTATAGDVSPDGSMVLVRGYRDAYLWPRRGDESLAEAMEREPCVVPLREEPQGESIAFTADGASYATLGERVDQPLWVFREVSDRPSGVPGFDPVAP